jgi:hypothetical protein
LAPPLSQNWGGQPEWQNWVGSTPGGGGSKGNQPGAMQGGGMQQGGKGGMPGAMQSPYGPEMGRMGQPGGDQGGQYSGGSTMSANNQGTIMNATPGTTLGFGGQWWGDQMPQSPMGSFGGGLGQSTPGWGQQGQQPQGQQPTAAAPPPAAPPPAAQVASPANTAPPGGIDHMANFKALLAQDPTGRLASGYTQYGGAAKWLQQNQAEVGKMVGGFGQWRQKYGGGNRFLDNEEEQRLLNMAMRGGK